MHPLRKKISFSDERLTSYIQFIFRDQRISFCLIVTFLWGLAAHAYGFLNSNFSHDSLNAFYATAIEDSVKIEVGRYFVPLYRDLFRGQVALPWLIGLLGLTFVGIAVYLVVRLMEVENKPLMVLISGVMSTNITFTAQIATYVHEFDCNCLALLLAVMAVWMWREHCNIPGFLLGSIFLLGSMGIYQSYFSTAMSLMIALCILDLFSGKNTKAVFGKGLLAICMLLCGGILYFLVGKAVYALTDIPMESRTDVFNISGIEDPIAFYLNLIKETYVDFRNHFIHNAYRYRIIRIAVAGLGCLMGVSGFYCFICNMKRQPGKILLICTLVILFPFAAHVTFFLARGIDVHDVMTYSIWLVWVIFPVLMTRLHQQSEYHFPLKNTFRMISYFLVVLVLSQNLLISNTSYMKKEIEATATLSTMTRVLTQLEQQESYVLGETTVAFIGAGTVYDTVPGFETVSNIVGLNIHRTINSSASIYYFNLYEAYFKYVLKYPIQICDDETYNALSEDPEVLALPSFPDENCMKMIDNVMVVKMG